MREIDEPNKKPHGLGVGHPVQKFDLLLGDGLYFVLVPHFVPVLRGTPTHHSVLVDYRPNVWSNAVEQG